MEVTKLTHLMMRGKVKAPKNIFGYEEAILIESDEIRRKRLTDLFSIYKHNASNEVLQLIQNVASTYSKLFVTEVAMQNQISNEFLDYLTRTLLVLAVIKRDHNTISSLINHAPAHPAYVESFFAKHLTELENYEFGSGAHIELIRTFWIHDIFIKLIKPETYSDEKLKLFGNLILTSNESVKKYFEKAFSSGRRLKDQVNYTENYYKIAKKFIEINISKRCTIKLLSMGLSNDLTRLDNLRFKLDICKDQIFDIDALLQRIFQVLIALSKLIDNKYVKLKCLAAARTCADDNLSKILEKAHYTKHFDSILLEDPLEENIMNQLEFFAIAIGQKISFYEYYKNKSFIASFDDLVHMNGVFDETELKAYDKYPKTERVKWPASYDTEAESQEENEETETVEPAAVKIILTNLDIEEIKRETEIFRQSVSGKFKNILNGFSNGFESFEDEIPLLDLGPVVESNGFLEELKEEKKPFKIDYEFKVENIVRDDSCDSLKIWDLCEHRYNMNEIETVMYYFILHKKNIYSPEDFENLNQNENYEVNKSKGSHAAIQYLIFRQIPEYSRLSRIRYIFNYPRSFVAALMEHYRFEPHPGNYNYVRISSILKKRKLKTDQAPTSDNSQNQAIQEPQTSPASQSLKRKSTNVSESSEIVKKQPHNLIKKEEDFHASDDLLDIFLEIERHMKHWVNGALRMDASQAMNEDSPYKVGFILKERDYTSVPIVIKINRNKKTTIKRDTTIELPCQAFGSLDATIDILDEIVYDELNEPYIKTTELPTITGSVQIYGVTHFLKKMTVPFISGSKVNKLVFSLFSRLTKDTKDSSVRRKITPKKPTPQPKEVEIKQEPNDESFENPDNAIHEHIEPEIFIKVEEQVESLAYGDPSDFEMEEIRNEIPNVDTTEILDSNVVKVENIEEDTEILDLNVVKVENIEEDIETLDSNVKIENLDEDIKMQSSPYSTLNDFEDLLPSHTIEISHTKNIEKQQMKDEKEMKENSPPIVQQPYQHIEAAIDYQNPFIFTMPMESLSDDHFNNFNNIENKVKEYYPCAKSHARVVCVDFRKNLSTDVELPPDYKYARQDAVNHNNHLSNLSSNFNNLEMYCEIDLSPILESSALPQTPSPQTPSSTTVTADSPPPSNEDEVMFMECEDKDIVIIIDD